METSMARLSTGKRINSASDDAAGVAISSRLSAEIRGTDQAIRNSLDGQALIDTAEGAHKEIENILQRMREVSVQAANDTNNDQDRANLQSEMDAMVTEIDRISSTTTWAGENLMQSAAGTNFSFQVGAATEGENQIKITIDGMGSKNLGIAASSGVEVTNAGIAQAAYNELVSTRDSTTATAKTAGETLVSASAGEAALLKVAAGFDKLNNDSATIEKQAGAIRDIMNGLDAAAAAGVASGAMPGKTALNMDAKVITLQSDITDHITDPTEQSDAQALLDTMKEKIAAFKATTTDTTAAAAFVEVTDAYDAVVGADTSVTAAAASPALTGSNTLGTITTGTTHADLANAGIATLAIAKTHYEDSSNQGLGIASVGSTAATGHIKTAEDATTAAKAALVIAEDAASAAQSALNASNDPADLKGVGLSVATGDGARTSITTIDAAIKTVNIQRSELGAVSNRLNHTVNNLTNISSNLSSAKGGIEDADFALETTNLAKNQILQQASTAMLAQANASKQNVLSLLQG
jgi:flagellin